MAFLEYGWDTQNSSSIWEFFLHPAWSGKSHPVQSSLSFYSVWSLFSFSFPSFSVHIMHSWILYVWTIVTGFYPLPVSGVTLVSSLPPWRHYQQPEAIAYVLTSLWPISLGTAICCLFFFYKENFFSIHWIYYTFSKTVCSFIQQMLAVGSALETSLWS